jgi:hypothetical protein
VPTFDRRDGWLGRAGFKRAKKIEGAATLDGAFAGCVYLMMLTTIATDLAVAPAPAVAVTLTVNEPTAAPPEVALPLEQPPMQSPTKIKPSAATVLCTRRRLRQPKGSSIPAKPIVEVAAHKRLSPTRPATALLVLMANVIVAGCTPSGVTVCGVKLQLTFAGKVPQDA